MKYTPLYTNKIVHLCEVHAQFQLREQMKDNILVTLHILLCFYFIIGTIFDFIFFKLLDICELWNVKIEEDKYLIDSKKLKAHNNTYYEIYHKLNV